MFVLFVVGFCPSFYAYFSLREIAILEFSSNFKRLNTWFGHEAI